MIAKKNRRNHRRTRLLLLGLLIAFAFPIPVAIKANPKIDPDIIRRYVPNARLSGEGRFSYWLWDIYDARLYAPEGRWRKDLPYALSLSYLREFNGEDIAERSVEEMREQGFKDEIKLAQWGQKMKAIFPDVDDQTTLIGIRDKKGDAIFYRNGRRIGIVRDSEFSRRFFAIWLGKQSSEPSLREKLLGKTER